MSKHLEAIDALALIPDWDPNIAAIELLTRGLTNRNFHVRYEGCEYVLRLESEQSKLIPFDRSVEALILDLAYQANLGPRTVFSDLRAGVMLREFLPGRVWRDGDLSSAAQLEALASLIRRVQQLPLSGHSIQLADKAAIYAKNLNINPGLRAFAQTCVEIIRTVPAAENMVCGHNDIVAANVIENNRLKLIDWEYACDNDPMYDLAVVIGYHDLDDKCVDKLLQSYTGGAHPEHREQLSTQLRAFDAIQWLWLATRHLVAPNSGQARRLEELQQRISYTSAI